MPLTRRTILACAGAGVALAVAGCAREADPCVGVAAPCSGREVIGYVPYWDQRRAFRVVHEQPRMFSQISPMWYSLDRTGRVVPADDVHTQVDMVEVRSLQSAGVKILPCVTNLRNGEWTPGLVSAMLIDPVVRGRHIDALVRLAAEGGYDGIDIDYEDLRAVDREPYSRFLTDLGAALHRDGRLLTSSVFPKRFEPGEDDQNIAQDYAAIGAACDQVRVMTFDYHYSTSEPGPLAPSAWVDSVLAWAVTQVPPDKLMLGIVLLGVDWPAQGEGETVSYEQATAIARDNGADVDRPGPGRTPTFRYTDSGMAHEVWYEDARSTEIKLGLVEKYDLGGVFFWRLGGEDPETWRLLHSAL